MNTTVYPELRERLDRVRLANGLTVLVCPKPGFARKCAYFVADFGAIHTSFSVDGTPYTVPAGTAHYLEHRKFELPGRDVSAEFAALGASVNAFTSYDLTAYYFSCTEHFPECLRLLLEFVSAPYFPQAGVDKERGIIAQEIGMNDDSPDTRVFENLLRALYRTHPIREPILGTAESISAVTADTLALCHRAFYRPDNMVLCVVGDVDAEAVAAIAEDVLPPAPDETVCREVPREAAVSPASPYVDAHMDVAMPTFDLAFACEPVGKGASAVHQEMVGDLAAEALFGESSALYLRLYEAGLIDGTFGGGFETVDGCAMFTCAGDSDAPEQVLDAILAEAQRLVRTGIPEDDFARSVRSALGRRIRETDSFESTCFRLCAYQLTDFDYFAFPALYRSVRAEELVEFLRRVVRRERCALSVILPEESL